MNIFLIFALTVGTTFLSTLANPLNDLQPRDDCIVTTVTSYSQVSNAVSNCKNLVIDGITVPAGETLTLNLQDGATLTLNGTIKFEFYEWLGPLMHIFGTGVTVDGTNGILDGQGQLYWDGLGGNGGIAKPKLIRLSTSGGSQMSNIHILNCPEHCVIISSSDLTMWGWNIDVSAGDTQGGHNTDGFDIDFGSTNIVIKDSTVKNQDDCVVVRYGSNMYFSGIHCSGSHGLSLSVGMSETDPAANVVYNIFFKNCTVATSANGIHVKTHTFGTTGYIRNVTYEDITLTDITNYGISIQEDYDNDGSTGVPTSNIPITNLQMHNIHGTVRTKAVPVYILCGDTGCTSWSWASVDIEGSSKSDSCNFKPSGYSC